MSSAARARGVGLALAVVATGWLACDGHLDFGVRRADAGSDGATGGRAAGTGGVAGATPAGPGGAGGCAADSDCRLTTLHCDVAQGRTCVECTTDTHCTRTGAPRCDLSLRRCVACLATTDCATGQRCLGARCISTCSDGSGAPCPAGTKCESGLCAACEADDDLVCPSTGTPLYCLASPPICVGCRTDADCLGGTPRCDPVRRACVACISSADCSGGSAAFCDPGTGTCVPGT